MGNLQERITSTHKGSITSFQAVYVPADDLTDPAPANTFAHLDSTIVLERSIAELGIYPAVDPLASVSNALSPDLVGDEHFGVAREYKRFFRRTKTFRTLLLSLDWTNYLQNKNKLFSEQERFRNSFPNLSMLQKCLLVFPVSMSRLRIQFVGLR